MKTDITKILKNKPKGIELYDALRDKMVTYDFTKNDNIICCIDHKISMTYSRHGTWPCIPNGLQILLPSKEMQDWEKFAWKKGDVLCNSVAVCLFDTWVDDTYAKFNAKFINGKDAFNTFETILFHKVDSGQSKLFIEGIERRYGKLGILEEQPELKYGDIVKVTGHGFEAIAFCKGLEDEKLFYHYALIGQHNIKEDAWINMEERDFSLATDSEKQQLFDALAKKGKRWNPETKVIEDLPKPHEFKPFDKVLVRDEEYNKWHINFFEGYDESLSYPYKCMLAYYRYCIPYEGNEHLVGTKDTPKENITVTIASSDDSGEPQFKASDSNIALT